MSSGDAHGLQDRLSQEGLTGWELVNVTTHTIKEKTTFTAFLKKPKN